MSKHGTDHLLVAEFIGAFIQLDCGILASWRNFMLIAPRPLFTKIGHMMQGVPSVGGFLAGFALAVK